MREREGKRLVPKEEFEALLHVVSCLALSAGEQRLQINHYYDTIDHGLGKEVSACASGRRRAVRLRER